MSIINFAIYSVTVIGFGYVAVGFVSGLIRRSRPVAAVESVAPVAPAAPVELPAGEFCCDAAPEDAAIVEAFLNRPVVRHVVVPFVRPNRHPALEGLSIRELKKLASEAKIKGYSNLTKTELIQRLQGRAAA